MEIEQERALRLLMRQIKDIQSQADNILSGNKSNEKIECFERYSIELKEYVAKKVSNERIKSFIAEIPNVNYSRTKVKLWQYLVLPAWWYLLYKDYLARDRTLDEINSIRGKYAHLELLVRQII